MEIKKVIWDKVVLDELKDVSNFLNLKPITTCKILPEILSLIKNLKLDSEIYALDRFKIDNDGNFRAFEKYHYRISYKITEFDIRILRIRHTSQNPKEH
jgi:ParE toxin of type II toxin-antitoxin system, parDE